ncbi:3-hydroxyacyl-CoA dehydrogenase family protein [Streptomyces leeuwenhoekii]|uniref:3-hydroxyacyl-CoA dehydrogenase family protein n=1 Tax=Streptomyces leeuwenhoekii TaxID=1437453 RepID=UPI0036885614
MSNVDKISLIGVVGLGEIGEALASVLSLAGYRVIGVDTDLAAVKRNGSRLVDRAAEAPGTVTLSTDIEAMERADLVIEAVPEQRDTKIAVLCQAAALTRPTTLLATTSTALPLTTLAVASGRPDRMFGLRCAIPPTGGGGIELVRTAMNSAVACSSMNTLITVLGGHTSSVSTKAAAVARELVHDSLNLAVDLHDLGYAPREDIDTAMRLGCGLPMGPFELLDHLGLDHVLDTVSKPRRRPLSATRVPAASLERQVREGRLGRKSGQGFHTYGDTGARIPTPLIGPGDSSSRTVQRVGVIGSGTMARGIAQVAASAGCPTSLVARTQEKADRAAEAIGQSMLRTVRRGKMTPQQRETALSALHFTDRMSGVSDCDLVIEAAIEDFEVKQGLFRKMDLACKPGTILATTTSSLSVKAFAEATQRPADVIGLHFFHPAPVMKLVEVVRTEVTADAVADTALAFCRSLGKTAVTCPDRVGFIVNFLLFPYLNAAVGALERGEVSVEELDAAAVRGFGYPMGPFALLDAIGLDVSLAIQRSLFQEFGKPHFTPAPLLEEMVAIGRNGRKTGAGFYEH